MTEAVETLNECKTTEDVVSLINMDGNWLEEGWQIAGKYATESIQTEYARTNDKVDLQIETHLDFLLEAGALFDYSLAIRYADSVIKGDYIGILQ